MVNLIDIVYGMSWIAGILGLLSIGIYIVIVVNLISYLKPQFKESVIKQLVLITLCTIWPLLLIVMVIVYIIKILFTDRHK